MNLENARYEEHQVLQANVTNFSVMTVHNRLQGYYVKQNIGAFKPWNLHIFYNFSGL